MFRYRYDIESNQENLHRTAISTYRPISLKFEFYKIRRLVNTRTYAAWLSNKTSPNPWVIDGMLYVWGL